MEPKFDSSKIKIKNVSPFGSSISYSNPFSLSGRTTCLGMWMWTIAALIVAFLIYLVVIECENMEWFSIFLCIPAWGIFATAVRRLHDHSLSVNWLFFLSPIGIALMYMAHVLDLDDSIKPVAERIQKTSGYFGWLFAAIAWFFVADIVLLCLLFLCSGKNEDNMYGLNPYRSLRGMPVQQ